MIQNHNFIQKLDLQLKSAILLVAKVAKNIDLKIMFGKVEAMRKAKDFSVTALHVGSFNTLKMGQSDFNSAKVKAAIEIAMQMKEFPKAVQFRETPKGLQLYIPKKED